MPKLTTEQFIEKARAIHGDKYDYSKVEYVNAKTKVCIVCKEHGEFWMRPDNFINSKQECPGCWAERRGAIQLLPQEEFIKRAITIHNGLYDYSKVIYSGVKNKVLITCSIHGDFLQTPSNHLKGKGCPYCSGNAKKWNKETCLEEARKYKYIHDYSIKSSGAYNVALRNGWLKEYTWLERLPAKEPDHTEGSRLIYAYEFKQENYVYVGLTNSMMRRDWSHRHGKSGSSVYKFAKSKDIDVPSPKILERDIPTMESGEREEYWVNHYKAEGWNLLNKAKTGNRSSSLGSLAELKWNKKRIIAAVKECDYDLTRFMKEYWTAYYAMLFRYRYLLDQLFPNRSIHTHHSVEEALLVAKSEEFENRTALRKKYLWAYRILDNAKLLDEVFCSPHKYTKEEALEESRKYKTIERIRLENHSLWTYLKNNNLFKEAKPTDPMFHRCKTVEEAWDLSLHFLSITELANHAKRAYRILREAGLLQKRYPESKKYYVEFWTKDKCQKVASKCKMRTEFKKQFPVAFKYANLNGWLDEFFPKK